jgi:AcrR family transcriptional regulator
VGKQGDASSVRERPAWQRRSAERVGEDALERSKAFVRAARDLAAEGGLEAVTLRPLLERAGLSRRAFYDRFESIDDVLVALYEETVARGAQIVARRVDAMPGPVAKLETLVRSMAAIARNPGNRTFIVAISSERSRLSERRPEELEEASAPMIEVIERILAEGVASGAFRNTDLRSLASTLHAVISSEIHRNMSLHGRRGEWVDQLCEFCVEGVRGR